jgi:predicted deacylase
MRRIDHALLSPSLGSHKTLTSLHYGPAQAGPKVYIQASLHAEELPGMLVAHHLRTLLEAADAAGRLRSEVVLVPVSNPLGLAQRLDHKPMGRFDLDTSENFNRHYPDLAKAVLEDVTQTLGDDPLANVQSIRQAVARYLEGWKPQTELQSLRHTLLTLAFDADYVLDLHCDAEAVLHFYCEESCWASLEPLARYLDSEAVLLAKNSGGGPFDECLSGLWWQLRDALIAQGKHHPIPQGCHSTTIEFRGEGDVTHALARKDAQAIAQFLRHIGILTDQSAVAPPAARCNATPLAGSETLNAPAPGVVVFAAQVGQYLQAGDLVAEVIDPLTPQVHRIQAGVAGIFYARVRERYTSTGGELGKIAGSTAFRTGDLLGN